MPVCLISSSSSGPTGRQSVVVSVVITDSYKVQCPLSTQVRSKVRLRTDPKSGKTAIGQNRKICLSGFGAAIRHRSWPIMGGIQTGASLHLLREQQQAVAGSRNEHAIVRRSGNALRVVKRSKDLVESRWQSNVANDPTWLSGLRRRPG